MKKTFMAFSHLYLTSTGRLARSLRHRFRLSSMAEGRTAWETLSAVTLNGWLSRTWDDLWSEESPAPELYRLHLWQSVSQEIPPPSPLERDIGLYRLLDNNYGTMVRHKLDPEKGPPSTPLVEWRRRASRAFRARLSERGFFHESELPGRVCRALQDGRVPCPGRISLAGFDSPAPTEEELFRLLGERCRCEEVALSRERPGEIEACRLASPDQEVLYLIDRLLEDAQSLPLHRIGVIIPTMREYRDVIERALKEITGEAAPQDAQWFNITLGRPVSELPLVQAAMLPLRFILGGEGRDIFLSLILSPYYRIWKESRHEIARADRLWRSRSVDGGLEKLLAILERKMPELGRKIVPRNKERFVAMFRGTAAAKKTVHDWIAWLEVLWTFLGFPLLADEADTLAWRHLNEILGELGTDLGPAIMKGEEFFSWFLEGAGAKESQTGGSEESGIQFMGLVESRGLDFDALYIVDMNDRSLPQPLRPLPFLDSQERKKVQGATVESQCAFAEKAFRRLIHSSPRVTLLRAEQEEGKPFTPSPFWPNAATGKSIDIWHEPGPAWIRAKWLRSAFEGIGRGEPPPSLFTDGPLHSFVLPDTLSVSAVERAIACPYKFFAATILGIEPLEEIEPALSPRERGTKIHAVVALFTRRMREEGLDPENERPRARALLSSCIDQVLGNVADNPCWEVERERWREGESSSQRGLLTEWLDAEIDHWSEGWRCIAEELSFKNLSHEDWPFALRGRIDRVDYSTREGLLCADYKTGALPLEKDVISRFSAPQLPLYVMALRGEELPAIQTYLRHDTVLSAEYIQLKSLKELGRRRISDIALSVDHWSDILSRLAALMKAGNFTAQPFPFSVEMERNGVCEACEYRTVCEKGLRPPAWTKDDETNDHDTDR